VIAQHRVMMHNAVSWEFGFPVQHLVKILLACPFA
jgi:hypothetical protein